MSGIAVESDNAMFAADAPSTQQPKPADNVQQTTDTGEVINQEQSSILGDVEQSLEIDSSGIGSEIDSLEAPEQPPTEEPPAEVQPVDEAGMKAFSEQFQKYTGVDLKDAMASYQQMTEAATNAQAELNTLYQRVSEQQQRLDLQVAWSNDPIIQQQVQSGTPLSAAIDQRLTQLRQVYETLGEDRQKRIDSLGSKGVLALWDIVNKKSNRSLPGVGTPPSSVPQSDLKKLSEIQAMSEPEFQSVGMKLLQTKQFINDMNL